MLQLVGLWDSPFVRRVAITMRLYEIGFDAIKLSVYRDAEEMRKINPQLTVPALILDDGEVLLDSNAIIDYIDELHGRDRALTPPAGPERRQVLNIIAQAAVACDKVGHLYRELGWRPEALRYPKAAERFRAQIADSCALLEQRLVGPWFVGGRMTQADVAVAVMLRFVSYYDPYLGCLPAGLPRLTELSQRCEQLPAFAATPLE